MGRQEQHRELRQQGQRTARAGAAGGAAAADAAAAAAPAAAAGGAGGACQAFQARLVVKAPGREGGRGGRPPPPPCGGRGVGGEGPRRCAANGVRCCVRSWFVAPVSALAACCIRMAGPPIHAPMHTPAGAVAAHQPTAHAAPPVRCPAGLALAPRALPPAFAPHPQAGRGLAGRAPCTYGPAAPFPPQRTAPRSRCHFLSSAAAHPCPPPPPTHPASAAHLSGHAGGEQRYPAHAQPGPAAGACQRRRPLRPQLVIRLPRQARPVALPCSRASGLYSLAAAAPRSQSVRLPPTSVLFLAPFLSAGGCSFLLSTAGHSRLPSPLPPSTL